MKLLFFAVKSFASLTAQARQPDRPASAPALSSPERAVRALQPDRRNFYRLAYSSIAPQKIAEGIQRIAKALAIAGR